MPWTISKSFTFEASHQLPLHDGPCARLHGHSYTLTVELQGGTLVSTGPKTGMLLDYGDLSAIVQPVVRACLDHQHLNTVLPMVHPTAELIAQWVYDQLEPLLPDLVAVEIHETGSTSCRYAP